MRCSHRCGAVAQVQVDRAVDFDDLDAGRHGARVLRHFAALRGADGAVRAQHAVAQGYQYRREQQQAETDFHQ
jgi:hypothetical protein